MAEGVIITGKLDDKLTESIDAFVKHVDEQFKQLANNLGSSVDAINAKLKNIGNVGKEGGFGESSRTRQNKEEAQSVSKLGESYDALAAATRKALDAKSVRHNPLSLVSSNIQNYRENLAQITQQLAQAETSLKQATDNKVAQLASKIEQDKAKVSELRQELVKLQMQQQQSGNFSMFQPQQLRIQQQIENKMAHIAELQQRINSMPTTMQSSQEAQKVFELRQQQERINQLLGEQQQKISGVTLSLDQQFVKEQQIAEILKSKASAQDAYMRATKMPTNTYDEVAAKLERLKIVQEALNRNPILPESNILRLGRVIDETEQKMQKLQSVQQQNAQATSATQNAVNQQAQAIRQVGLSAEESARQVMDAESRKQTTIRQTGLDAQQTAQQIIASMHQQAMLDSDSPIMGIRQLTEAIKQMKSAYYSMGAEQESPIGQALRRDIENAERARQAIKEYNQSLMSLNSQDTLRNASFYELKEQIASLTDQYRWMTRRERESAQGRELIEKFQQLSKSANDVQRALNRPISLDKALGLSASTLDEINYKMQMLRNYLGGINVDNNPKAAQEIQQVNKALDDLKAKQQQIMGQNKQLQDSNTWLARSFQYMKNRIAFYFTVGASTQFVKNLIEIRSQYEMTERALGILIDSAERGSQIFNELSTMALQSPFTLMELSNAAKQLTAYDVAAKDVVDTTRRLADMASAVGVNIDRLTYALGQVKAYGYLNARDARMFANAGIPLVKQLADYYTELEGRMVSVGDVYDRIKKKAIGYEDTMAVITKMTDEGGKFFDFQAKMADTLKVQLANLTLAWNNMLNDIGKSNSSLLTAPIKGLKTLFASWKQIELVFKDIAWTLGGVGVIRLLSTLGLRLIGVRMESYAAAIAGQRLGIALSGIGKALVALMSNPWTWIIAIGAALADLALNASRVTEAAEQLSAAISRSAEESIKSLSKFREVNDDAIKDLYAGLLQPDELTKLWQSLQEELENSADSSSTIIPQLMSIADQGERVKTALDWAKRIDEANEALKNMGHNLIKINTDEAWGIFGEGVVSDIKDWANALYAYKNILKDGGTPKEGSSYWEQEKEAIKEIEKVAYQVAGTVEALLGEEGMKDRIKVGEAVARIKQQIKLENPEIQGEVARLFDIQLDQILGKRWVGVYDNTTRLWQDLMSEVKKDSSSAFQDLSQEWLEGTEEMTNEQKKAFNDAANHLRDTLPPAMRDALDRMMADINSRDFRINVGIAFNTKLLDDIQKDFNKHFLGTESGKGEQTPAGFNYVWSTEEQRKWERENSAHVQKYARLNKKEGESTLAWQKRLTDEYKSQNDNLKLQEKRYKQTSGVVQADAQAQIQSSKEILSVLKEIGEYEGFDVTGAKDKKNKKSTKSNKKSSDELANTLKKEISLVKQLQNEYDKLTKAGVGQDDALLLVQNAYSKTLEQLNKTMDKFKLPRLDLSIIKGKDPNEVLKFFTTLRDLLSSKGLSNVERLQAVEGVIQEFTVSAKTYNLEKITKGLNNELDKIKEEYELGVELDANPELGGMFADFFGIDTSALPKTFAEAYDKANEVAKEKLKEMQIDAPFFDLMKTDMTQFAGKIDVEADSKVIEELIKQQKTWRDMFEKNFTETEKMLDDYVKKYGDYSDKIAEIEADRLQKLKKLNEAYYTEQMRRMPEYAAKLNAIQKGADREKGKVKFDEFKNSRLYVTMFENLQYVSTATLETIRKKLEELKSEMGSLSPEQLKQVVQQFEKIDNELRNRNPFKGLIKNYHEYTAASGKAGKQAQKDLILAQEKYDKQLEQVTALKEELEQKKASGEATREELDRLRVQISSAQTILDLQKQELEEAIKLNEQYNLAKKAFGDQWQEIAKGAQVLATNLKSLGELRDYLKDAGVNFGDEFDGVVDSLQGVSEGISQIVSSAQNGDVFGVVTGTIKTVFGIGDAIAGIFGDGAARTRRLNREIEESQEQVRKLNMAYKELERTVDKAMGAQETAARRATIANKQAEKAELERQLRLEKSKRSKDRDDEKIKEYEEQIQQLTFDIEDLGNALVENLLGTDIKSAAEDFIDTWVDAWKQGETTLDAVQDKMDDVVKHLIKKAIANKVIGTLLQPFYDAVDMAASEASEGGVEITLNELKQLSEMANALGISINDALTALYGNLESLDIITKGDENKDLSALQQGIQGITEDTAGALEAYMNGVSQQVYLHSDLLTQIRDILINFGGDVTIATNAQILLQLQQSFQVQMTIQNTLTGVLNASGLAFRVELAN